MYHDPISWIMHPSCDTGRGDSEWPHDAAQDFDFFQAEQENLTQSPRGARSILTMYE
jgi:hypothetical protein